jgi:hypothetical protein
MLMGIESAHKSNQLFESPLDPLAGKFLSLLSFPPHGLLHYISTKGESVPPERHLQAIRDKFHCGCDNKEQLFVPLSIILEDGREMIGLLIHRGNGCVTPQFLDSENESTLRSRSDIFVEEPRNQNQPTHKFSEEVQSKTENKSLDKVVCEHQLLDELVSYKWANEPNDQKLSHGHRNAITICDRSANRKA